MLCRSDSSRLVCGDRAAAARSAGLDLTDRQSLDHAWVLGRGGFPWESLRRDTDMSATEQSGLSGVWEGLFSYPRKFQPTPFTAVLLEFGSAISGAVHELCNNGPSTGTVLNAMITGTRLGSEVQFVKQYEAGQRGHGRPINYEGALNADATEIEGQWAIPGNWSGKFLMIRTSRPPEAILERHKLSVPSQ